MISFIHRDDLDLDRYNSCIENSLQSNIFGYSWYLDIVCKHWGVFVLNDYEAVMPIPWNKKYLISYVYPPLWLLQLGIFSKHKNFSELGFINELKNRFRYIELRLNYRNKADKYSDKSYLKQFQYLPLNKSHKDLSENFNRNRKRDLKKAKNNKLVEKWNDPPENLIRLFEKNISSRIKNINEKDYQCLLKLMNECITKGVGEVLSIYDKDNRLVASGFFLFHKNRVTELVCASDFNHRNNGANTFLIDCALFKYQKQYDVFDFGGSSIQTIRNYYKSFGASEENYSFFKYNQLPFLLKLFKR
ncbi:MAG: hypothetical protein JXQ93_06760 [Flavobacteriaceae bacterium]